MKKFLLLTFAIAALALPVTAAAQEADPGGNGEVCRSEVVGYNCYANGYCYPIRQSYWFNQYGNTGRMC